MNTLPPPPAATRNSEEAPFQFREPPIQKSIAEWGTYIEFIEDQVKAKVKNDANLPSLACTTDRTAKITYLYSKFDDELLREVLIKYVRPIRLVRSKESLTQHPSFLRGFKSDTVTFWQHALVFYGAAAYLGQFPADAEASLQSLKFANELYNGEYDSVLRKLPEKEPRVNKTIEMYQDEFRALLDAAAEKPVAISSFVSEYGKFHGTAGILYKSHGKYFYGVYDPIFYSRPDKVYVWPVISTYLTVKTVADSLGVDVTLLNLSGYCLKSAKGIHCPQYIVNAEYCIYYSAYFLYLWARAGAPKGSGALRRVVDESYIVGPAELRREPCIASKRFRLVSMGFILSVILVAVETHDLLVNVGSVDLDVQTDGFNLIHPDLRGLIPKFEVLKLGGGRRRTRRLRRK